MAKPVVDGLERDLETRNVELIRLNITSQIGRQIAGRFGVRYVPSLAVFDASGQSVLSQAGSISSEPVLDLIDQTNQ